MDIWSSRQFSFAENGFARLETPDAFALPVHAGIIGKERLVRNVQRMVRRHMASRVVYTSWSFNL